MSHAGEVKIDMLAFAIKILNRVHESHSFCYPDNYLDKERVHPQLMKIDSYCNNYKKVIGLADNSPDNPIAKYIDELCTLIVKEKKWAYPDNYFDAERAHATMCKIQSLFNGFKASNSTLINYLLKENPSLRYVTVDVESALDIVGIRKSYEYAYPDNQYDKNRAHASLQKLQGDVSVLTDILDSMMVEEIENKDTLLSLKRISPAVETLRKNLKEAYPNGYFDQEGGHAVLSKFIKNYNKYTVEYRADFKEIKKLTLEDPIVSFEDYKNKLHKDVDKYMKEATNGKAKEVLTPEKIASDIYSIFNAPETVNGEKPLTAAQVDDKIAKTQNEEEQAKKNKKNFSKFL
jgi:hypothetical protein